MASLIGELHFWTLKDELFIKDNDIGCFRVYDKGNVESSVEHPFATDKQLFAEGRNITWNLHNKRPEKLRDNLKELQDLMTNHRCVSVKWEACCPLQMAFSNGVIASVFVNAESTNFEKIVLDRHLVGKFVSDHVVDVIMDGSYLLVSYVEPKMTCVYFNKASMVSSPFTTKKGEKLSALDPKLITVDLVGPSGRRMERKLSLNSSKDCVLVWWHNAVDEVWPWTPINSTQDRTNMLIYSLNGSTVELMCSTRIDVELIAARFSNFQPNQVFTLEESMTRNGDVNVDVCVYEISQGKCLQVSLTTIPLQGHIISSCWSPSEEKLLLSCDDCSLVMYDAHRHVTHLATTQFLVVDVAWHPSGTLVIISSERGQLQCFDAALSCVKLQIMSEDILPSDILEIPVYFRHQPNIFQLIWQQNRSLTHASVSHTSGYDLLCLVFEMGPLAFLRLSLCGIVTKDQITSLELISQYLKCGQVDEAVCLLLSLDWNRQGELCFQCLQCIVNYLLRRPLNHNREAQLEAALGTFYNPSQVLPEMIIIEYRDQVGHLARRFFHYLLRFQRFDKAFLLAVDLGCRDLFLDLHHVALDKRELALAEVALQRAEQLDNKSVSSSDTGESVEYDDNLTEFSDDSSGEDDGTGSLEQPITHIHVNSNTLSLPQSQLPTSGGMQMRSNYAVSEKCDTVSKLALYKWPVLYSQVKPDAYNMPSATFNSLGILGSSHSQSETLYVSNAPLHSESLKNRVATSHVPPCALNSVPFRISEVDRSLVGCGEMPATMSKSSCSSAGFTLKQKNITSPFCCNSGGSNNSVLNNRQDQILNKNHLGSSYVNSMGSSDMFSRMHYKSSESKNTPKDISKNNKVDCSPYLPKSVEPDKTHSRISSDILLSRSVCNRDFPFRGDHSRDVISAEKIIKENQLTGLETDTSKKLDYHYPQTVHGSEHSAGQNCVHDDVTKSEHLYYQDHLEEEDLEGARVKFVHFGVV